MKKWYCKECREVFATYPTKNAAKRRRRCHCPYCGENSQVSAYDPENHRKHKVEHREEWSKVERKRVEEMLSEGHSWVFIAHMLRRSLASVRSFCQREGIKRCDFVGKQKSAHV